jgi:FAD dependent oxidoreductase TIGR03364
MASDQVVIVGGGILGTMHALEACSRGWAVDHLEADAGPRRASVRNFGLIWLSGRAPGPELELALRARTLWERLAVDVPDIGFRPDGSVTVATDSVELALMAEAIDRDDASARSFELLDAPGVRSVNPAVRGDIVGGLFCRADALVEPGTVLGALRAALEKTGSYRWIPGRQAVDLEVGTAGGPTVVDHTGGRYHGSLAILCIGDRRTGIGGRVGSALEDAPLRRCRLQMMQTSATSDRVTTALADGDSLRYYPAFDLPGRSALPTPNPETAPWNMQLLLAQRADGALTLGDTHVYDEPFDFAVDQQPYDHLVERAEAILGWTLPPVVRRWAGVYSLTTDGSVYWSETVAPGVTVVTGTAGRGMTLSPAIAEQTWEAMAT